MLKKQIINFIMVGVLNTIVGYALYAMFISLGFNYILAVVFATILGVLFNFKTIGKYVFGSHDNSLIVKFFAVYLVVFIVNVSIIKFFKLYEYNDYIAGLFAVIPSAVVSFILNKYLVFKK